MVQEQVCDPVMATEKQEEVLKAPGKGLPLTLSPVIICYWSRHPVVFSLLPFPPFPEEGKKV